MNTENSRRDDDNREKQSEATSPVSSSRDYLSERDAISPSLAGVGMVDWITAYYVGEAVHTERAVHSLKSRYGRFDEWRDVSPKSKELGGKRHGGTRFSSLEGKVHVEDQTESGKTWITVEGEGCRVIERRKNAELDQESFWVGELTWLHEHGWRFTRVDVAFDDHAGLLDLNEINRKSAQLDNKGQPIKALERGGKLKYHALEGKSWIYGTHKGSARPKPLSVVIYDREKVGKSDSPLIRVELRAKTEREAERIVSNVIQAGFSYVRSVIFTGVRFRERDHNKPSRPTSWPVWKQWIDFLAEPDRLAILRASRTKAPTSIEAIEKYVLRQFGPWLSTAHESPNGVMRLARILQHGKERRSHGDKYLIALEQERRNWSEGTLHSEFDAIQALADCAYLLGPTLELIRQAGFTVDEIIGTLMSKAEGVAARQGVSVESKSGLITLKVVPINDRARTTIEKAKSDGIAIQATKITFEKSNEE